jgi:hypothetical protein
MASFSERQGHTEIRTLTQRESLDEETRLALWNTLVPIMEVFADYRGRWDSVDDTTEQRILLDLWTRDFQRARDERFSTDHVWGLVKKRVLTGEWNEAMDILESVVKYTGQRKTPRTQKLQSFVLSGLNRCFEIHLVGYRFIRYEITPVDSNAEAEAISAAQTDAEPVAGARHALDRAVELLADRAAPDYPNSIKESISAVEAIVKKVTGEGTLGAGLGKLNAAGLTIHPALKIAWIKMYGWTSDDDGIRHGGIGAADADQALAKYVLVTCSAFVSYLVEEGNKRGLL